MPGTGTVGPVNVPLPPLVLSTAEDTYTLTFDRIFPGDQPASIRLVTDAGGFLFARTPGGPYHYNQPNWPFYFEYSPNKVGDVLILYIKAVSGTPNLYVMPTPAGYQ